MGMKIKYMTKEQWLALDHDARVETMAALYDEGCEFELDVDAGGLFVEVECDGHPAGPFDPMGETVYCDGSCKA